MKILMLVGVFLLLFNCEDKQSQQKNNSSSIDSSKIEKEYIKKDSVIQNKGNFPLLNDKNALEFFRDYGKKNKENKVRITTTFGVIDILLFEETIYHRANFIYLTKKSYFDNTQFYRVVNNFVIQGGNSDDPEIAKKRSQIGSYLLPPDTKRGFKHDKGVISMPSSEIENAYKMASPFQFFIVQADNGAYHLDGEYTAFGKVIAGIDVVDKIAEQETDSGEWPVHNIYIKKVEIIK